MDPSERAQYGGKGGLVKRKVMITVALAAVVGCTAHALDLGSDGGTDGSSSNGGSSGGSGGSSGTQPPNKCIGAGAGRDASAGDAEAPPGTVCYGNSDCPSTERCMPILGFSSSSSGLSKGFCSIPCQSDCDCPVWLTCQSGTCAGCTTCPAGQECRQNGSECPQGNAQVEQVCVPCYGGCPSCASNSQCQAGQVCISGTCQSCTSSSQCGPHATCQGTHTGTQCACSQDSDCTADEQCQSGTCTPRAQTGCTQGFITCDAGQACINNVCGACSTYQDCNPPFPGPSRSMGLTCINGTCTQCTANSQCGGGQACVGGTCGTCALDSQCGSQGQCNYGYCVCTTDAQCQSGQRCGAGVCVVK